MDGQANQAFESISFHISYLTDLITLEVIQVAKARFSEKKQDIFEQEPASNLVVSLLDKPENQKEIGHKKLLVMSIIMETEVSYLS